MYRQQRKTKFLHFHPPAPPAISKQFGKLKKKQNKETHNCECEKLKEIVATRDALISELARNAAEQHQEINNLHSHVEQLELFIQENQSSARMKNELSELRKKNTDLQFENEQLKCHIKQLNDLIEKSQKEYDEYMHIEKQLNDIHADTPTVNLTSILTDTSKSPRSTVDHIMEVENMLPPSKISCLPNSPDDHESAEISIEVLTVSTDVHSDISNITEQTNQLSSNEINNHDFTQPNQLMIQDIQTENGKLTFTCDDCGFQTKRRNNLTTHQRENCKVRRINGKLAGKDQTCRYCSKKMTHNSLRSHIRHYIVKNNRRSIGAHSSISINDHLKYLDEIKLTK